MKHQRAKQPANKHQQAPAPAEQPASKPLSMAAMGKKLLHGMGFAAGKQALSPSGGEGSLKELAAPAWQKGQAPTGERGTAPQIGQRAGQGGDGHYQSFVAKQRAEREAELAAMGKRSTGQAAETNPDAKQARRDAATKNVVKADASRAWVTEGGPLVGKDKHAKYQDEDKKLGWRTGREADKDLDTVTTRYESSAEEREASRMRVGKGGKVSAAHADKAHMGYVLDPKTGQFHTFDGQRLDAVEADGSLTQDTAANFGKHRSDGKKIRTTHHTTPLAGAAVAGAGLLETEAGHIKQVSDESGHYTPSAEHTHQTVRTMAEQGMAMQRPATSKDGEVGVKSAQVKLTGYDHMRGQGKAWLGEHKDKGMHQQDLVLPYQAFLQTHGNEAQARFKKGAGDELLGKRAKAKAHKPGPQKAAPTQADYGTYTLGDEEGSYVLGDSGTYIDDAPAPVQKPVQKPAAKPQQEQLGHTYYSQEGGGVVYTTDPETPQPVAKPKLPEKQVEKKAEQSAYNTYVTDSNTYTTDSNTYVTDPATPRPAAKPAHTKKRGGKKGKRSGKKTKGGAAA